MAEDEFGQDPGGRDASEDSWPRDLVDAVAEVRTVLREVDGVISGVLAASTHPDAEIWRARWQYHLDRMGAELGMINPLMANPTIAPSFDGQLKTLNNQVKQLEKHPEKLFEQVIRFPANLLNLVCVLTGRRAPSHESDISAAMASAARATTRAAAVETDVEQVESRLGKIAAQLEREKERTSSLLIELQESGQRRAADMATPSFR